MTMPTKDTKLVEAFLSEFVKKLPKKEIDFILLFGSAARGEFRAGISDIDLIIQVRREGSVSRVEKHAEKIFWELDKKHGTRLAEVCSTRREDVFSTFEKKVKLYKPFEVLGPKDIDWKAGKIQSDALGPFAVIAPVNQFAKKVKKEGKVLYGRDILEEIAFRDTVMDKMRSLLLPYYLSIFGLMIFFLSNEKGLRYSIKAVLYAIDDQISVIGLDYARSTSLNMRILRCELGQYYSVRLAKEALYAKKNFEKISKEWGFMDKLAFCAQAPFYIFYNNLLSLLGYLRRLFGL